ncbi:hypothetical protein CSKR_105195 [Clonorchis sinensis]|uniref:Uncharacterized protein n=1 Tax=Clonorchis sinensis TaxID=79923 RepID=A0A3R7CX11_CLOSI|nr:hypothetical protein CSKR_105195 [Clonorchis sinensis]
MRSYLPYLPKSSVNETAAARTTARQCLEREYTDWKICGSDPTSVSRLLPSRLGQLGSIPVLVLPSSGMAAKHRKGVKAERFFHDFEFYDSHLPEVGCLRSHNFLQNLVLHTCSKLLFDQLHSLCVT